jgi:formylglycine-generating enzyme required for sulfatase activity/serine/threonine protein phosphatase PrpC
MLTYDIAGAQIDGARDYQEDAFLITHLGSAGTGPEMSLCVVADGMGGHAAGNVASNIAVQTFNKYVTGNIKSAPLATVLRNAAIQANNSIRETVRETAALKGMGCTLAAILLSDTHLHWVSVGDSHLYLLRDGVLTKKNADHSYGGFLDRMAAEGTVIEPEAGFSRNMLMSALTGEDIADIDCPETQFALRPGDKLVIASDGLDSLSSGIITEYCSAATSAKECVDSLLKGVVEADLPRQDNTTIIAISVAAAAASPAERPNDKLTLTKIPEQASPKRAKDDRWVEEPAGLGKRTLIGGVIAAHLLVIGAAAWWFLTPQSEPVGPGPSLATDVTSGQEEQPSSATDDSAGGLDETSDAAANKPSITTPTETSPPTASVRTFRDNLAGGGQGPLMVAVPAGNFLMGSPDSTSFFDQRPQHTVHVPEFAMSVYEVSVAEYAAFAGGNGRRIPQLGPGADRLTIPATFVPWNDALAYAQWLSRQTGKQYRLPTEAEWEYAARAGTTGNYWWGHNLGSGNAHCMGCDTGLDPRNPTRIGRFRPNQFGLYDMSGNVQEWVYDCYHPSYDGAPSDGSVFEGGDCTRRVVRGGAFGGGANSLRSAHRDKFPPNQGNDSTGIRLVRTP